MFGQAKGYVLVVFFKKKTTKNPREKMKMFGQALCW
jgi:hypothetical protein